MAGRDEQGRLYFKTINYTRPEFGDLFWALPAQIIGKNTFALYGLAVAACQRIILPSMTKSYPTRGLLTRDASRAVKFIVLGAWKIRTKTEYRVNPGHRDSAVTAGNRVLLSRRYRCFHLLATFASSVFISKFSPWIGFSWTFPQSRCPQ